MNDAVVVAFIGLFQTAIFGVALVWFGRYQLVIWSEMRDEMIKGVSSYKEDVQRLKGRLDGATAYLDSVVDKLERLDRV